MRRAICGCAVGMLMVVVAGCSSSSKASAPTTTTLAAPSTTTVAPATTTTPTTASSPSTTVPPASADAVARAFFAAWAAHNATAMSSLGSPTAVTKGKAAWSGGTSGFAFSNCQGAAGSIYCTWVGPGAAVVIRVDNVTVPRKASDFMRSTLDATGIGGQFFDAWVAGAPAALLPLGDSASAKQATDNAAQNHRAWVPAGCSGAAGSTYCTWNAGSAKVVIQVQNQPPAHVLAFTYTP